MAILSPVSVLGPAIFLFISVPLVLFAALTTSLAITALTVRGSIVYIELAIAVLQSYVFSVPLRWQTDPDKQKGADASRASTRPVTPVPQGHQQQYPSPPRYHRRNAPSTSSSTDLTGSQDSLLHPGHPPVPPSLQSHKTDSWNSLLGAGTIANRDYEGVGGWRIPLPSSSYSYSRNGNGNGNNNGNDVGDNTGNGNGNNVSNNDDDDYDAADDALWLGMNSRLELPAPSAERPSSSSAARHRRSLTGASQRFGAGVGGGWAEVISMGRMSPAVGARTPSVLGDGTGGGGGGRGEYFDIVVGGSGAVTARVRDETRRKSVGGSSTSSGASSGRAGAGAKQASYG